MQENKEDLKHNFENKLVQTRAIISLIEDEPSKQSRLKMQIDMEFAIDELKLTWERLKRFYN